MGTWKGRLRQVNGKLEKLCTGPLHPEGKWIPITNFYFRPRQSNGRVRRVPRSECKDCSCHYTHRRYPGELHGMVPLDGAVLTAISIIEERIGSAEACRRLGWRPPIWWRLKRQKSVRKPTAVALIRLAHELKQTGESIPRNEIKHGTAQRSKRAKV